MAYDSHSFNLPSLLLPETREKLTTDPLYALRTLYTPEYNSLIGQFFMRTREFELGLAFVARTRELLIIYRSELSFSEYDEIEMMTYFDELAFLDRLNRWHEYLCLFEEMFANKRTPAFLSRYSHVGIGDPWASDEERFGRYLLQNSADELVVHSLYLCEDRRKIIERKLIRKETGKSVEHLKRHQREQLPEGEWERRFVELIEWFSKRVPKPHTPI